MPDVQPDSSATRRLLERLQEGDPEALDRLLRRHRRPLLRFVEYHLDPRLRARLDASDVVQDAFVEAVRRVDDFLQRRPMPFHLWLRKTTYERLLHSHRDHRTRARRTVEREADWPERSSLLLARQFLDPKPSPSQQMEAHEVAERVRRAVEELGDADREILLLRHVDELPYEEIACLLEIEPAAARKRYGRAMIRLQQHLCKQGLLGEES
jgi:RNA polymerase sigma-70 factor (ECF subfamily)